MEFNILKLLFLTLLVKLERINCLDNGLVRTPPMGWMSWERFRCITDCNLYPDECISDKLFRKMADLMSSEGYLEAGYEYLIIDDCWLSHNRDSKGRLQPDPARFPYGMKDLADYVHSKGLKFGMYENFGGYTCAGYPGIIDHLEIDAKTFVEWGIDYIKIDGCNASILDYKQGYTDFGKYLNESGRPIVYSCSWSYYMERIGIYPDYQYISEICNLWRFYKNVYDEYVKVTDIVDWYKENQERIAKSAGPGHWNDPDMLIIGNYGLSYEQSKTQMALWAILAAPLLMSTDLRTIGAKEKEILLNKDVIAINQDQLGIQGLWVKQISKIDVWVRPITPVVRGTNSQAIAFHSRRNDGYAYAINVALHELGIKSGIYSIKNIYNPESKTFDVEVKDQFMVKVKPSGVVLLTITPVNNV